MLPSATSPGGPEAVQPFGTGQTARAQPRRHTGSRSLMPPGAGASQLCCVHSSPAVPREHPASPESPVLVSACLSLLAVHVHTRPSRLAGKAAVVAVLFCHSQKVCSLPRQITWMLLSLPTADFLPRSHSIFFKLLLTKLEPPSPLNMAYVLFSYMHDFVFGCIHMVF